MPARPRRRRKKLPVDVVQLVLHEAGYKCGNPNCRHIITLDIHHIVRVADGGPDAAENLLPLCGYCHDLHHDGEIPIESIRAWKMLLLTLNEGFDRRSLDHLLLLDKEGQLFVSGDGILTLASLLTSGLVEVISRNTVSSGGMRQASYVVQLSPRGKATLDAWKRGDQAAAVTARGEAS